MSKETELSRLRRYFGYTQKEMADSLGIDIRTYINKEKGVSQFKLNEMFIISKKFGLSIEKIFLPGDFTLREKGGEKTCNN